MAAVAVAALMIGMRVVRFTTPASPPNVSRTTVTLPRAAAYSDSGADRNLTITPDGRRLVYIGNNTTQLFVRPLDSLAPTALTTGAQRAPFVSPDSQWVAFVDSGNRLRKVAMTGGPVTTVTQLDAPPRGAAWGPDDTIVLATTNPATGLLRVSASGGTPQVLTTPDHSAGEVDHLWPALLPNGRGVLFTITAEGGGLDSAEIAALDLRTGNTKVLVRGGTHALYASSGHLVYATNGMLRAVAFDQDRLEVRGQPVTVVPRVTVNINGASDFAIANDGTLVYVDASVATSNAPRTLVWVDRSGKEESIAAPPRAYTYPRISPDGTRVALAIADQDADIWVWDLRRGTLTRLTFDAGLDSYPVWTPDSTRLIHNSARDATTQNLWWRPADGTGAAERLTSSANAQQGSGVTPDGRQAIFHEITPMGRDLFTVSLDGSRHKSVILATAFDEHNGVVSPNGRWIAYESDSSGGFEIYVRTFPDTSAGQWQVSSAGGTRPVWSQNGQELFFLDPRGALMHVLVHSAASWSAETPAKLLEPRYFIASGNAGRPYDVAPDGSRFLMIKQVADDAEPSPEIVVVQHWTDELRHLVPER
jgi:serine/threonine-protein kinase